MKSVRASDIACRYGGEEFAIVLPEASLECARERAEQMRLAIRDTNLTHLGQTLPAPTASFGIAVYPTNGTKSNDLLKAADQALYRAKQEGRDRVCVVAEAVPFGS
jgi:diguanylate cyclase (GGDEF)-like protein